MKGEYQHRQARIQAALDAIIHLRNEMQESDGPIPCLGDLITQQREAWGLSIRDLAERSGVDKAMISRLENHHDLDPRVTTLSLLAEALKLTPERLFACAVESRRQLYPTPTGGQGRDR